MPLRRRAGTVVAPLLTVALALPLGGCGTGAAENDEQTLVIGVTTDQPGLGVRNADGTWSGFEVDLARYLAAGLGYRDDEVTFAPVVPANRERLLENGTVDMVLATYTVADENAAELEVAGPYYIARQDLLVAADDTSITGPESLDDKILCSVAGSGTAQEIQDDYAPDVRLQEFDLLGQCVDALRAGEIDAVTADDIVLAGYLQDDPDDLRIVDETVATHEYGVGLPPGSPLRDDVEELLRTSFTDGTWAQALSDNLGDSGLPLPSPPTSGTD